jgi:hypothetical protein
MQEFSTREINGSRKALPSAIRAENLIIYQSGLIGNTSSYSSSKEILVVHVKDPAHASVKQFVNICSRGWAGKWPSFKGSVHYYHPKNPET